MKHDNVEINEALALFQYDIEGTKLDSVGLESYIAIDFLCKFYLVEPAIGTSQS
jgi:hypothetical protein